MHGDRPEAPGKSCPLRRYLILCLAAGTLLGGCHPPDPDREDTPTSGRILLLADADCRAVIEQEWMVFSSIYTKAEVQLRYLDEASMLKAMLNDSVRGVVTTAALGGEQEAWLRTRRITPRVVPIYHAGIAVVADTASPLRQLDLDQVRRMLDRSAITVTTDMSDPALNGLQALFAGAGSGVARLLQDSLGIRELRASSVPDVPAAIDAVSGNARTVAFLPFEAISDLDDPEVRAFRSRVRLLPVARNAQGPAVLPSQSSLADGSYPLQRTVNMVLTEGKSGLGTGFVSFVANHKGQRIILKLGVAPVAVPARDVEMALPSAP
jgi:phosphate transport system substrate-binding protein